MIYLKGNDELITANLFIHGDFSDKDDKEYFEKMVREAIGKEFLKSIVTESYFDTIIKGDMIHEQDKVFNSFNLKNDLICLNDIYEETEILFESNLPINMKKRYLYCMNGYFKIQNFNKSFLASLTLKNYQTYNILELRKVAELCHKLNIYSVASDIVSSDNIKVAEENVKVLRIAKKISDFEKENN